MEEQEPYVTDEAHTNDAFYVTFTAEEIGQIAVLIIKKIERSEAIRSMPRYTTEQHGVYAAFYDELRETMAKVWEQ
jgi:hypothetical protein